MTDNIKLPPLPPHPNIAHEGGFHLRPDCQFTVLYKWARSYARAAVEADRASRQPAASAEPECWCETCRPITLDDMRMVLCPICGNKRCPHATDHRNACTGSNEPGQPGSSYGPRATPVAQDPYAYEYGRSNGDGTYSVVIERGQPRQPVEDWPVKPLYAAPISDPIAQEPVCWWVKWNADDAGVTPIRAGLYMFESLDAAEKYVDAVMKIAKLDAKRPEIVPLYAAPIAAQPSVPEGWKMVPVEPSIAMCIRGAHVSDQAVNGHAAAQVYAAMLNAAPTPPAVEQSNDQDFKGLLAAIRYELGLVGTDGETILSIGARRTLRWADAQISQALDSDIDAPSAAKEK